MIRTELDSAPEELDTLRRKIMQLEIEQAALKKETDQLSKRAPFPAGKELSDMRDQFQAVRRAGKTKRPALARCRSCAKR